jgi:peptidoglycan/xylan/chitin deacetylase (PgdA/CDA1 family)
MNKIINYQNIKITTFLLTVVFLVLFITFQISLFFLLIPFLFYTSFTIYGTFCIDSQFYTKVICKFESANEIALTFDDGPNPVTTEKILDTLKKNHIKATFFCIGKNIEKFPEIFQRIVNEGHIVGNHTMNHVNFLAFLSAGKVFREISETNNLIKKYTGKEPVLFRPPIGILNPIIIKIANTMNIKIIGWSLRSLDTVKSENEVLKRLSRVKAGDIILLHDNRPNTPEILEEFLRLIVDKDLKCVGFENVIISKKLKKLNSL